VSRRIWWRACHHPVRWVGVADGAATLFPAGVQHCLGGRHKLAGLCANFHPVSSWFLERAVTVDGPACPREDGDRVQRSAGSRQLARGGLKFCRNFLAGVLPGTGVLDAAGGGRLAAPLRRPLDTVDSRLRLGKVCQVTRLPRLLCDGGKQHTRAGAAPWGPLCTRKECFVVPSVGIRGGRSLQRLPDRCTFESCH